MNQDLLTAVQVFCDSSTTADDATLAIPLLEAVPSTCSLPEFVEGIGQMLTSTDNLIRRRATQLLFLLVSEKAAESLARPQQLAIVQFFSARLADFPSVEPALGALRFLVTEYDSIAADAAPVVCAGMFDNLNITDMEQKLRQLCFGLLETLLSRQDTLEALVAQGPAFVSGFIESMEGEKDPRCLVVCLRTAATILGAFDSVLDDDLIEELFDVTACYFPITFTPPPNDPFGISKQSLVLALRSVFTASPLLCPLVVPVLLEKLSSSLVEAKMNSLQTLIAGVPVYGIEPLLEFVPDIRDALQNEVGLFCCALCGRVWRTVWLQHLTQYHHSYPVVAFILLLPLHVSLFPGAPRGGRGRASPGPGGDRGGGGMRRSPHGEHTRSGAVVPVSCTPYGP